MKNIKQAEMIDSVVDGIKESVERYEKAVQKQKCRPPFVGYTDGVNKDDSRESIKRRITFVREQLLLLSKSL